MPAGWALASLREVVSKAQSGGTPLTSKREYYGGLIPFVRIEDMVSSGKYLDQTKTTITQRGLDHSSAWLVPENSLLYSMYASYGVPVINKIPVATNQAIIALIPESGILLDYLYYYLLSYKARLRAQIRGTTQENLNAAVVTKLPVPVAPTREQERIVSSIEELFSRLDSGVASVEKTRELAKRFKQSVLKVAFEGRLTARWREVNRPRDAIELLSELRGSTKLASTDSETPKTRLPRTWVWAKIKEICTLINGRAFKPSEWAYGGLPIIRIQNLNGPDSIFHYCDFEVDDKFIVENKQLLFGWSGTPGTSFGAHIWNGGKAVLNQHIFKVMIDERKVNKVWLMHLLNSRILEYVSKAHGTAGLAHITKGKFEGSYVPLAPTEEQGKIAESIDLILSVADSVEGNARLISEQSASLRQSILASAFRGLLVPQNPDDEPSDALLRRIVAARPRNRRNRFGNSA